MATPRVRGHLPPPVPPHIATTRGPTRWTTYSGRYRLRRMKILILLAGVVGVSLVGCSSRETPAPVSPPRSVGRYSVADLYQNSQYSGASFSAVGRKVLVSSNRSGIWNAYAVPVDGGEPEALTHSTTDSILAASYFA